MSASIVGALGLAAAIVATGLLPMAARWRLAAPTHPDLLALRDAGMRISLRRWEASRAAAIVFGAIVGSALGSAIAGAGVLAAAPSIAARVRAAAARDRARAALAPLIVTTHAGLRSGLALPEALRRAAAACDDRIARRPFEDALARFDLGDPLDSALTFGASNTQDPRVADAMRTLALGVSERMPVERAAALLNAVAELVRYDESVESEVRARSAGIRFQIYMLAAVVPVLALYLFITMPGLAATLGSPLGRTVLVPGAVVLEVAGIAVSRQLIRNVVA